MPAKQIGRFALEARARNRSVTQGHVDRAIEAPNQRSWRYERWLDRRRRVEHEVDIAVIQEAAELLDSVDLHRWPEVKDAIRAARHAARAAAQYAIEEQWRHRDLDPR